MVEVTLSVLGVECRDWQQGEGLGGFLCLKPPDLNNCDLFVSRKQNHLPPALLRREPTPKAQPAQGKHELSS